ncbi:MAG: hypothetical protein EOO92_27835 [Pedobacter sp.]|nr:MAG: hypothetical protein EOO92_27835 [Pedobacter sp.]
MGKLLERAVKRSCLSATDVAKVLRVNRRTLYNWFIQETLKGETVSYINDALIIAKIEYITVKDDNNGFKTVLNTRPDWSNKYFELLQDYSDISAEYHQETDSN